MNKVRRPSPPSPARALAQAAPSAQARQEAIFNSMVEGVLLLDRENRIQFCNESFQRMFSLRLELRGRTLAEAFPGPGMAALARRVQTESRILGVEIALPGAPDQYVEVNASVVYDPAGRPQGGLFVFHDLTRLKQLEKTRQEFVANVSHELRTPLSMIKGFVETLLDGACDDPEVSTRFLRNIEKHANRLTYLIEDLLTISRLESRQVSLNYQEVDLALVARKVLDDLEARAAEKEVRLENRLPGPLLAQADAERVQQVLFNLVENAIKYGRSHGQVVVGGQETADGKLEVWVQDDGPGIPVEARDRVFERFYRVDRARSRETGGTGLGLSIVKHIIQAHGGEVWVNSQLGQGATFCFTLPKVCAQAEFDLATAQP